MFEYKSLYNDQTFQTKHVEIAWDHREVVSIYKQI